MEIESAADHSIDPVSNALKWILLAVAVATFAVLAWTTGVTYQKAPDLRRQSLFPRWLGAV